MVVEVVVVHKVLLMSRYVEAVVVAARVEGDITTHVRGGPAESRRAEKDGRVGQSAFEFLEARISNLESRISYVESSRIESL